MTKSEALAVRAAAWPAGVAVQYLAMTVVMLGQYALTIPHLMVEPDWQAPDDGDGELLLA